MNSENSDGGPSVISDSQSLNERIPSDQMLRELNVDRPTEKQEAAYERSRSKISRYAAERSNRRGRSRDRAAFENKYFGLLTDPQKLKLGVEYDDLSGVGRKAGKQFRENEEERKLDGTVGAVKGLMNMGN